MGLGGLGAARVEDLDDAAVESVLHGDGMAGESVEDALARVCEGRRRCYGSCGVTGLTGAVGRCSRGLRA